MPRLSLLGLPSLTYFAVGNSCLIPERVSRAVYIKAHELIASHRVRPGNLNIAERQCQRRKRSLIEKKDVGCSPVLAGDDQSISVRADYLARIVDAAEYGVGGPGIVHCGELAALVDKAMLDIVEIVVIA